MAKLKAHQTHAKQSKLIIQIKSNKSKKNKTKIRTIMLHIFWFSNNIFFIIIIINKIYALFF